MEKQQAEQTRPDQSSEHVELARFEQKGFVTHEYVAQQAAAARRYYPDHDCGNRGKLRVKRVLDTDDGVATQSKRVGKQKGSL